MEPLPENEERTIWHFAQIAMSLVMFLAIVLAIPWVTFYRSQLYWDDSRGIAFFLGVLAVLNAVSLLIRVRIIESEELSWTDLSKYHISMAFSTVANVLLWSGMALWFVHKDLDFNRAACFAVCEIGALGHCILHYIRWQRTDNLSAMMILTVYILVLVGVTMAFLTGQI